MPAHLSRRVVLDSDSEREDDDTHGCTPKNHSAAPADALRHTPHQDDNAEDSSGSESTETVAKPKRGRKPKPKLPSTSAPADDARGKHKRFTWSNHPTELNFLQMGLDDILATADSKQRRQKKKALKKDFMDKYGGLGDYNREEFDNVLNNWLKNHLQFPNLRKVQHSLTSQAADATNDESPTVATTSAQPHSAVASATTFQSNNLAPLLQSIRRRARGTSGLWAVENAEAVRVLHTALGGTIGDYKTAVHQLYTALSDAEKALWEAKAEEAKDQMNQDETQCFKNQADFPLLIANLIASFFGYQPDQVGSGLAHLRMALRNEAGGIEHDQYTIGLHDGTPSFDIYAGGPKQDEIDRWGHFVDDFLPMNPVWRDARLTYEADGLPKLPTYNDEWTVAEARSALDAWFHAMWAYAVQHGTDLPHGLDWSNFQTAVAPHVPSQWRGDITGKPSDRPFHRILTLYHDLFEAQDMPNAFRWISSASSTTAEPLPANHAPPQTPSTCIANHAPPQTPSRRVHTIYTTPTKPVVPVRDQSQALASARPLPSMAIPSLDTIHDEDDPTGPAPVDPVSSDPTPDLDDREHGSANVGEPQGPTAGVAEHAATPTDSGDAVDKASVTGEHVGTDLVHEADDVAMEEGRDTPVADSVTMSGDGNEQHDDDPNAHPGAPAEGVHADPDTTTPGPGKRKRQGRHSELTAKRAKASASEIQPEAVSADSRHSARPKHAPPGSPRKTRSCAQHDAREAVANTRQTRARKGSKA
ncbi:hypothetical protein LXA43DRAFT_1103651 [Ganoderma leucocontextum]|nr:hypothetical protein LXA43DRAFT_1103651 [Ganoderma leucocontextum]